MPLCGLLMNQNSHQNQLSVSTYKANMKNNQGCYGFKEHRSIVRMRFLKLYFPNYFKDITKSRFGGISKRNANLQGIGIKHKLITYNQDAHSHIPFSLVYNSAVTMSNKI